MRRAILAPARAQTMPGPAGASGSSARALFGRIVIAAVLVSIYRGEPLEAQGSAQPAPKPPLTDRERYLDLIQRKERAERLNALWRLEAELSAKKAAYALLDLSDRKLYFKVRGRAFKAVSLSGLETERGSVPIAPEELAWRAFTLQIKEGKGVETETIQRKTLTPEEARLAGRTDSEGEPIGAEQGAVESGDAAPSRAVDSGAGGQAGSPASSAPGTQKIAGVAGGLIPPDPPRRYHLGFDGGLSIWVVADTKLSPQAARYESFLPIAKALGRLFVGTPEQASETRLTVHLPLDRAQQIFRQLLPGQRLLITL